MKSKPLVVALSFFLGSTGVHRFYLGQNQNGWTTLIVWWTVLPALIYAIIRFNLFPNWEPFLAARIALPAIYQLFEAGRFALMNQERFKSQDKSLRNTIPLTAFSMILFFAMYVGGTKLIESVKHVDIRKTDAEVVLSSAEMSSEFRKDEVAYRKKYDNKILQIEGTVMLPPGEDFETQTTYLELGGAQNDAFGIKCFFLKENSKGVSQINAGDNVTVKGECNGNILDNCLVIKIEPGSASSQNQ